MFCVLAGQGGCHSNEKFVCLGGMGILFTAAFTYFGFGLLLWGSLWNASLLEKLGKAKAQWDQLRGNSPAGQTMTSPIAAGSSEQNVASVGSDAEFKKLVGSSARIIVQFSASWYDKLIPPCHAACAFRRRRSAVPATRQPSISPCIPLLSENVAVVLQTVPAGAHRASRSRLFSRSCLQNTHTLGSAS